MTIAAGFRCRDGVLLCADSQITFPGYLKFPEAKIISLAGVQWSPSFVYCGDVYFSKDAIHRLGVGIGKTRNAKNVTTNIRHKSGVIYREQMKLVRLDRSILELLMTFKRAIKFELWHLFRTSLSPVAEYQVIGAGMVIMRAAILPFYNAQMTLRQASLMAAYGLYQTKEHVDYCGKKSLIYLVFDDGRRAVVTHDEIEELEQSFESFLSLSASILTERNKRSFSKGLDELNTKLQAAFEQRRQRELLFL